MVVGELGFWWRSLGGRPPPRPSLAGPTEADIAIVGAGLTGLWTAFYLARARPDLRIVVLEANFAGYGAAGRNGGWVVGSLAGAERTWLRSAAADSLARLRREMWATVDEVGSVLREESIDADFCKAGHLAVAVGPAQLQRVRAQVAAARARGVAASDLAWLDARELAGRVRIAGALGAAFSPHAARVHPARLVAGLARAVERRGVTIYESTPVGAVEPGRAVTPAGDVRARWVVRATEGYTATIAGAGRVLTPINSSMIVTAPLEPGAWQQIGWSAPAVIGDAANVYAYLQRTADGRIAIGGRGVPYRFASRTGGDGATAESTIAELRARLAQLFPSLAGVEIEQAWSGVLGVTRDWCPVVAADAAQRLAWAGGYVGEGVAAANLAGRTLSDLLLGERSELTSLAWVARAPRRWEPEPLRWTAIRAVYALYRRADRLEARSGRMSRLAALVDRATGRV
ncbi:MAG TPA: FAD-binding oxidoreductase [Solirubrobacteraceae bacterium]|nr:FAD-binding oxidoreductase [Solirubrobacteraceae bacterium]